VEVAASGRLTMDRPIDRLRRLTEAGHAGSAPAADDLSWLADATARYLEEARLGLTMDDALALTSAGQSAWWRVEARERRNEAIVDLYRHRFSDIGLNRASREIVRLVQGAQKPARPSIPRRTKEEVDPTTGLLIEAVMYSGAPLPAPKQIANILEISLPP
jgi:hypothetical protein